MTGGAAVRLKYNIIMTWHCVTVVWVSLINITTMMIKLSFNIHVYCKLISDNVDRDRYRCRPAAACANTGQGAMGCPGMRHGRFKLQKCTTRRVVPCPGSASRYVQHGDDERYESSTPLCELFITHTKQRLTNCKNLSSTTLFFGAVLGGGMDSP